MIVVRIAVFCYGVLVIWQPWWNAEKKRAARE